MKNRQRALLFLIADIAVVAALGGLYMADRQKTAQEHIKLEKLQSELTAAQQDEEQQDEEQLDEEKADSGKADNSTADNNTADAKDSKETLEGVSEELNGAEPGTEPETALETVLEISANGDRNKEAITEGEQENESATESELESETDEADEAKETGYKTISIRGDYFLTTDSDESTAWPIALQSRFTEAGSDVEVVDYTMEMYGTLTQMWYAGVPVEQINTYIDRHKSASNADTLKNTELQIRTDYEEVDNSRNDDEAFPIIMMGFYGGYNSDITELTQQIQEILDTYEQQEDYLVVGMYPSGWTASGVHSNAEYDDPMENAFGEHYLSAGAVISSGMFSAQGRSDLADLVYEKLKEMYPEWIEGVKE